MTHASISTALARFAVGLEYRNIPPEVGENAKLRLLDTVGVCLASIGMPYAEAVRGHVEEQGGRAEARLFGSNTRLPLPLAVLYNASLAHGNDYDDTHSRSIVHPGGVVVPTALAAAEKRSRSGGQTLAAIVAGYEIATRVGMVASKGFHAQGFHPTGVCGVFGAVATAAKQFALGEDAFAHALGIAGRDRKSVV
jgi:2-methylcitrate dehydratase PrpD